MSDYADVDALAADLRKRRPLSPLEVKRLREEFAFEYTFDSNAIEGNTLTLRETALILKEGITISEKPLKDHLEAVGHKNAFDYIVSSADTAGTLTERAIKHIHSLVLMNDTTNGGVWRSAPVRIIGAAPLPQPYMIIPLMEGLLADYQDDDRHVITKIADFHLRFEQIHPFIDGNGRTGRLIMNLELIKAGLLPVNIKFSHRQAYYNCFRDDQATTLASLIAEYEKKELEKYIDMLEKRRIKYE